MKLKSIALATLIATTASVSAVEISDDITARYWNVEGKTEAQINERVAFLMQAAFPRTSQERMSDLAVRAKYKDAIVMDTLTTGAVNFPTGLTAPRYNEMMNFSYDYGYTYLSTTLSNGTDKDFNQTIERLKETDAANQAERRILVKSVDDIYKAKVEGRGAYDYHLQGAAQVETMEQLEQLNELGLNRVNFAYNTRNQYADGISTNMTGDDQGLSDKGIALVKKMNELGIIVDCSHSSDQTCIDAAKVSTKPVILSHTNPRALMNIRRNASDEAIEAVAASGGLACNNMVGGFLNDDFDASPKRVAESVQYVAELVGKEHTCMGVDYVHNMEDALHWIVRTPEKFPVEEGYGSISSVGVPADIWAVVAILEEQYDWTETEIRGFLGLNYIRVMSEVMNEKGEVYVKAEHNH